MFQWIKRSSSKKIRQHLPKHHRISFIIKKGVSTVSFSSTNALETSLNYDFKESFKSFEVSKKTKQISRRLISKFRKRTKDVSINKNKNRSMDNLINDSMDKIEESFVNEEEAKFIVDGKLNEQVSIAKQKKKSSDNCDKNNWEVIVNEDDPLTSRSSLMKIEDPEEVPSQVKSNETDVADKLRDLKFNCSFDGAKSCDKYTCNCEEEKCFGEVPGKIFSRSVLNNPENRVPSYMIFPLKSAERSVANGSRKCNSNERVKKLEENERPRVIEENCWRRLRVSKSSDHLHNEDLVCSFDDVAEFGSLNDFPCTGSRVDDDRDENIDNENTEVQEVSLRFDYEDDENSNFVDNHNVSYVISMYV